MREVIARTSGDESPDRLERLTELLATGLERLFAETKRGAITTPANVDLSNRLSPNTHAPNNVGLGEWSE